MTMSAMGRFLDFDAFIPVCAISKALH